MKNKSIKYALIVAVIIIWVLIIFRAVNYLKPKDYRFSPQKTVDQNQVKTIAIDTFSLNLNYNDPFTYRPRHLKKHDYNYVSTNSPNAQKPNHKTKNGNNASHSSKNRKAVAKKRNQNQDVIFNKVQNIAYLGMVKNTPGKKTAYLIYQGANYLVCPGQKVDSFNIKDFNESEISVLINDSIVSIKK